MSTRTEIEFLEEENQELREAITVIRERMENVAAGMELSAAASHPSKKSEIERGCAQAIRELVRSLPASEESA